MMMNDTTRLSQQEFGSTRTMNSRKRKFETIDNRSTNGTQSSVVLRLNDGSSSSTTTPYYKSSSRSLTSMTIFIFLLCTSVLPHDSIASPSSPSSSSSSPSSPSSSSSSSSRKALLTIFDFAPFSYRAEVADYGSTMDAQIVYASTLMVPPKNHSLLCEIPPNILPEQQDEKDADNNATSAPPAASSSSSTGEITSSPGPPIALLVSLGGCHPLIKAQVALTIQQRLAPDLKYIVFYNNNPNDPDAIVTLLRPSTPTNRQDQQRPSLSEGQNYDYVYACGEGTNENGGCVDIQELEENNIVFVSVSTGTGTAILGRMERLAAASGTRPELLSPENSLWSLPMVLERVNDDSTGYGGSGGASNEDGNNGGGQYPQSYGEGASDSFFWFRALLFTLLIVSPCFRAGYLWHAAGGRIHLRRNEDGRIIGLLYVPPMTNWFGHHHQSHERSPVYSRLTEEQVLALPEIVYVKPADDPDDVDAIHNNTSWISIRNETSTDSGESFTVASRIVENQPSAKGKLGTGTTLEDEKIRICSSCADSCDRGGIIGRCTGLPEVHEIQSFHGGGAMVAPVDVVPIDSQEENPHLGLDNPSAAPVILSSSEGRGPDEEQPIDGTQPSTRPHTTTTCTACSICIDEFEEGEKLRLLPRCGHAFHTECILPWLTERQGSCPLCKTSVLDLDNETDDDEEENEAEDEEGRERRGGTEVVDNNNRNSTSENTGLNNVS